MEGTNEKPFEAKELEPTPPKETTPKNETFSNINLTPSRTSLLNPPLPKYTNLLTSPVRRILYPNIYPGY